MSFALITALHHTSAFHKGPWYIALPVLAVVVSSPHGRRNLNDYRSASGRCRSHLPKKRLR